MHEDYMRDAPRTALVLLATTVCACTPPQNSVFDVEAVEAVQLVSLDRVLLNSIFSTASQANIKKSVATRQEAEASDTQSVFLSTRSSKSTAFSSLFSFSEWEVLLKSVVRLECSKAWIEE